MWVQCEIELPDVAKRRLFGDGPINGRLVRQWVAKVSDQRGLALPAAVFNYGDDGMPASGIAPVRFGCYAKGIRIVGVGAVGEAITRNLAATVADAMMREAKVLLRTHIRTGRNTFAVRPFPLSYFTAGAILSPTRGLPRWLSLRDQAREQGKSILQLPEAKAEAERLIEAGLQRQFAQHFVEAEGGGSEIYLTAEDESARDMRVPDSEGKLRGGAPVHPLKVEIVSAGDSFVVPRMSTLSQKYQQALRPEAARGVLVGVKAIEFTVTADLRGSWAIGRLQSQGNGIVFPARVAAKEAIKNEFIIESVA